MSHKLFHHSILSNARVWDFLKQVDATEAEACRAAGCPRCGGVLHSATYPRLYAAANSASRTAWWRRFARMSDASACAVRCAGAA